MLCSWGTAQLGGYVMITLYEVVNVAVQVTRLRKGLTEIGPHPHPTITKTYWLACASVTGVLFLSSMFLECAPRPIIACICLGIVMLAHNFAFLHELLHGLRRSWLGRPILPSPAKANFNGSKLPRSISLDLHDMRSRYAHRHNSRPDKDLELSRADSFLPATHRRSEDSSWVWRHGDLHASLDSFEL